MAADSGGRQAAAGRGGGSREAPRGSRREACAAEDQAAESPDAPDGAAAAG